MECISRWSGCPDEGALLKKRPALKDLVAKVKAANEKATSGLPSPPVQPAASGFATAWPFVGLVGAFVLGLRRRRATRA